MNHMPYKNFLLFFLVLILILLFPTGISTKSRKENPRYQYTFICPLMWEGAALGIMEADQKNNVCTKLVGSPALNPDKMADAFQEAIYSDVDGIITAGMQNSDRLSGLIDQAARKNIPVVLIDSDLPESARITYIGHDNYGEGKRAARELQEATGGNAKIGIITASLDIANQKQRIDGFLEEIGKYPDMEVLEIAEAYSERLLIMEQLNLLLTKWPDLNALYLTEGYASEIVGSLLSENDQRKLSIVSIDGISGPILQYLENNS